MISLQEQLRVLSDVARRHLGIRLHGNGNFVFPVYAQSGGLDASLLAIFLRGNMPDATVSQDFGNPPLNDWKLAQWKDGAGVSIRFSLGLSSTDLRTLLEKGASALEGTPIQSGTSAQGETSETR